MGGAKHLRRQALLRLGAAFSLLVLPAPALAQATEAAVKAAFLPKFAGYVAWPANARPADGAPLLLCLVGSDPFGRLLDEAVRGQQVGGRSILLRRVAGAADAGACHVAFVQGATARSSAEILTALQRRPVLTVTDARAGAQGMIHFVLHQGRVRFHIDEAAASSTGLAINSRLLGIALSVKQRR